MSRLGRLPTRRNRPTTGVNDRGGGTMQRMRGRFTLTIVAVALAIGAAACTGDAATGDKPAARASPSR